MFVLPGIPEKTKEVYLRLHKFFGVSIFVASIAQCCVGIAEFSTLNKMYEKSLFMFSGDPY